jgi:quinol monooxygenase YgiN
LTANLSPDWSVFVIRFAQQTRLLSTQGNADELVAKFIEAAELQSENRSCELMLVAKSEADDDVVYVIEIWSSESAWDEARHSNAVAAWARDLPELVAESPTSTLLTQIGGKGIG